MYSTFSLVCCLLSTRSLLDLLTSLPSLSTGVPTFKDDLISSNVLQRLIKQNVVINLKVTDPYGPSSYVFTKGKTVDYFVLILQGRVEVDIGKENMLFEGGPFMYFGLQALTGRLQRGQLAQCLYNPLGGLEALILMICFLQRRDASKTSSL